MAKQYTPPTKKGCKSCGGTNSDYWMNEETKTWWYKDKNTKEPYTGKPGPRGPGGEASAPESLKDILGL